MNKDESIIAQSSAHDAANITAALLGRTAPATTLEAAEQIRDDALQTFEWFRERIMARTLEIGGSGGGGTSGGRSQAPAATGDESDPGNVVLQLRKHKGKTIAAVHEENPEYLTWCLENVTDAFLLRAIRSFLGLDA